jgi:hypothetical protein
MKPGSELLDLVVTDSLPEANPDIQQSQSATQSADKTIGHDCAQTRPSQ